MTTIPPYTSGREPDPRSPLHPVRAIPIEGTFRSPSGRTGTMSGSLRVESLTSADDRWRAEGVFTGQLVDANGVHVGTASRRQSTPVLITRDEGAEVAVIGPAEVDLLGLVVHLPAVKVRTGAAGAAALPYPQGQPP